MQKLSWLIAFVVIAAGLAAMAAWWPRDRAGSQSTLTASAAGQSPYVDEAVCAECHPRQADSHQASGHSDTFRLGGEALFREELAGRSFKDPVRGYTFQYHEGDQGLSVSIPELFGEDRFFLKYALGSGQHAVTFLTLLPDGRGDTIGVEHRLSMYRVADGWEVDLTPGHQGAAMGHDLEAFGKLLHGDKLTGCIGCHTVTAELSGHGVADLLPNVGCQSCHGPGREHVVAMQTGGPDGYAGFTERSALEEIEACGQCHRLPSNEVDEHLSPNILQNVRFQPAGLLQSSCFKATQDLRCSTCHDPHQQVLRDERHYVQRCLSCHGGKADTTICPVSATNDCIRCHMPAIDVHRGIRFHDHWIRVRPELQEQKSGDE